MRVALILALALAATLTLTPTASAHRSGCHRWHSCPSDTGAYTCGDLGYDTYCPAIELLTLNRTRAFLRPMAQDGVTLLDGYAYTIKPCMRIARNGVACRMSIYTEDEYGRAQCDSDLAVWLEYGVLTFEQMTESRCYSV